MHAREPTAGRSFRHRFEGPFFRRIFLGGVRRIPQPLQRASMPLWAGLFHTLVPSARRVAEQNLERILGPLPATASHLRSLRLFVNYAQSITNLYALHLGQPLPVDVSFEGREHVLDVTRGGRGAVTVTGHLGAWQIMPFLVAQKGGLPPMTMAMAEEPNAGVSEFEESFRARFRIVYTTRSPFALIELARVLREGELVGMQLDRHLGGPHLLVPFFGRPAAFPVGPAMLARTARCPIIPVFAVYPDGDRRRVKVCYEAPIEVPTTRDREADLAEGIGRTVAVYERYVRRYPDQWFNFYDFWRTPARRA